MFTSAWARHAAATLATALVSITFLTAAIGPATQPAATLAARVLA